MSCARAAFPCLVILLSALPAGAQLASDDPLVQQAYIKGSNTEAFDWFGGRVAVSGDTAVVAAHYEASSASGVNGDQSNDDLENAGAVYVFVRNGGTWSQQAYLKASNPGEGDIFGSSVAIAGDTIVVGAFHEDSSATGVNANQADDGAPDAGAAYVFVRNGTTWTQQAYLKASNTDADDWFGWQVAIAGDTIAVGAPFEDSSATGVNGNQADDSAAFAGAVYVFTRAGTTWTQQAYLKASNTELEDQLGWSVAIAGDTIVAGAPGEDSSATGVNGNQASNANPESGAAYVFTRSGSTWAQQAYVKASNSSTIFGWSAAASGDTLVIGAELESSNATGVNGNQADTSATGAGAAYVFARSGTVWSQQAYLKASNTQSFDFFGGSVAVSGDVVVVGAREEDSAATGLNGNGADNSMHSAGAAYVFVRSGTTWSHHAYLKSSNAGLMDLFGEWVALDRDSLVVGAGNESSNATGINGNQADNSAFQAGAAYTFDLGLDAWTDLGSGLAGVNGIPKFAGSGSLVAGSPGSLDLTHAKPSAICTLHVSLSSTPVPFKGGVLVPFPPILNIPLVTSPAGGVFLPFLWPAGMPPGTMLWFQDSISDLAAINKVSLSNALKGTTP